MQNKRLFILATSFWIGILTCHAQDPLRVSLQFLSFPKSLETVELELRETSDKTVEIQAPSNELSRPLVVASPGIWSVGKTIVGPDGESTFAEYGRVQALASKEQILILVRKGKENSDGFDLLAIDGSIDAFNGGKFLFMNAAKIDIAGKVAEEKFIVRPGTHKIITPKVVGDERTAHAMFYFRKDDEARPFFSSRWPVNERARSMVFFYHDPQTQRLKMHTIRDYM